MLLFLLHYHADRHRTMTGIPERKYSENSQSLRNSLVLKNTAVSILSQ